MLSDSVRVLTRWLRRLARPHKIVFSDHRRRAKRRCLNIANHRGKRRLRAYRDLLKVARKDRSLRREGAAASGSVHRPAQSGHRPVNCAITWI